MNPADTTRPFSVTWLGYGGLIPFLAGASAVWFDSQHQALWAQALLSYGAVILSFVGALHWGFAMTHPAGRTQPLNSLYIWSVVPSLLGWVTLLVSPKTGATFLIAGFLTHYLQDRRLAQVLDLPP
jgi:uncharacterized membrane protein